MNKLYSTGLGLLALSAFAGLSPSLASAHIDPLAPLKSRGGDQKAFPCDGTTWGQGGETYTFEPGATITVGIVEGIKHDGYFRIAFDQDGDASFKDPVSIDPFNANRVSQGVKCIANNANDKCGKSDFCTQYAAATGVTVLWDRLNRHLGSEGGNRTWTIKLPDVECAKCTIQIIQVMEDAYILPGLESHGPYCPKDSCTDSSLQDIYHRCIDVTLKKGAKNSTSVTPVPAPADPDAIDCTKTAMMGGTVMVPDASVATATTPDAGTADAATTGTPISTPTNPVNSGVDASTSAPLQPIDSTNDSSSDDGCSVRGSSNAGGQFGPLALLMMVSTLVWRRRRTRA